jgi:hypothetical protein
MMVSMKRQMGKFAGRAVGQWLLLTVLAMGAAPVFAADTFTKPTPEEMAMTEVPGYPGAPAVVLFDEEITKDDLHVIEHYRRVKILTQEGVEKYANVELNYFRSNGDYYTPGNDQTVGDIAGRTIHADGTVIPFTGKPYLKTLVKDQGGKYQSMVFTLPDVQVGSIIEYRYATRYNDQVYAPARWYIQGELYVKSAHYAWYPTTLPLIDGDAGLPINAISWFPILPVGAKIVQTHPPAGDPLSPNKTIYDLVVHDIPPQPKEEHMPPIANYGYRVLFNFTPYTSVAEFWKAKGKHWTKEADKFAGPNGDLKKATQDVIAGATTPDEKLRKIYAAVMELENTDYTRVHDAQENKAEGGETINNAYDVLKHKRGDQNDLTLLFVGMARAAGLEAYAMRVPDRSEHFFLEGWLSMEQLDDTIAIVNVDGKEQYFDPGSRYCAYGHLAWQHTFVQGLRQTASGTDFGQTLGDGYVANATARVANLKMDDHGEITGKIDMEFKGAGALDWRQRALRGDEESLRHALEMHVQNMVPKSLEVKVAEIKNVDDYEKPLDVSFDVTGTLGTPTGKRLVMPVDLFTAGETATFPQEKRDTAVYFHYPESVQDALRVNFTTGYEVEATPAEGKFSIPKRALYDITTTSGPTNFTTRRTLVIGDFLYVMTDYTGLRGFYSQFEAKDQESVVLKTVEAPSSPGGN